MFGQVSHASQISIMWNEVLYVQRFIPVRATMLISPFCTSSTSAVGLTWQLRDWLGLKNMDG